MHILSHRVILINVKSHANTLTLSLISLCTTKEKHIFTFEFLLNYQKSNTMLVVTMAKTGPESMYSTRPAKNGLADRSA